MSVPSMPVIRRLLLWIPLLASTVPAQVSLEQLHQKFQDRRLELVRGGKGYEAIRELTVAFTKELAAFLERKPEGFDAFNGRLMLIDYQLSLGEKEQAVETLEGLDTAQAPVMTLAAAAEFAGHLGLGEKRERLIELAIEKDAPFEERMALGMHLMTRLGELERGQKIFDDAYEAATSDEERAKISYYAADSLRHREDLSEDAYDEALKELASRFPKTHYGSIAADRLKARELEPGSPAIPLTLEDLAGKQFSLSDYRGKVVLLDFWAAWCGPCREAMPDIVKMYEDYHEKGLEIIGIAMDEDVSRAKEAIEQHGIPWRQVCDGKGPRSEAPMRYAIDMPPRMVLIDREGKIASLHLFPYDERGLEEARRVIEATLEKK